MPDQILLPRNMTSESLPTLGDQELPMVDFQYGPSRQDLPFDGVSQKHIHELGDRLNIGREAMGHLVQALSLPMHEFSLTERPRPGAPVLNQHQDEQVAKEAPFALSADRNKRARYSEFPSLPAVIQKFKSPLDVAEQRNVGPSKILVTSQTVVQSDL